MASKKKAAAKKKVAAAAKPDPDPKPEAAAPKPPASVQICYVRVAAGPGGVIDAGTVAEVSPEEAEALVEQGAAVYYTPRAQTSGGQGLHTGNFGTHRIPDGKLAGRVKDGVQRHIPE